MVKQQCDREYILLYLTSGEGEADRLIHDETGSTNRGDSGRNV